MGTLLFLLEVVLFLALVVWAWRNEFPSRRSGASGLFGIITDAAPKPSRKRKDAPSWQAAPVAGDLPMRGKWRGSRSRREAPR